MKNIIVTENDQEIFVELCADLLYLQEQFGEELTRELTELAFLLNNLKDKKNPVDVTDFAIKMLASIKGVSIEEYIESISI